MRRRLERVLRRRPQSEDASARLRSELVRITAAHLAGRSDALVVVLGPGREQLVDELRDAGPGWTVMRAPEDEARRLVDLALAGKADVILDRPKVAGRHGRFRSTFFHLRPGGIYVVPGGSTELAEGAGPLGRHLAEARALPPEDLRSGTLRTIAENQALTLRMHVSTRVHGSHLLLSHDLTDVLVKLDEPQGNEWVERSPTPHRVLEVIPAEPPPDAAVITEGPERRDPPMDRPVTRADISLRDYRDVVVDVEQTVVTDEVVLPDTFRHNQWNRLFTRGIVDVAPRFGVPMTPVSDDLPRLEGTYLHLDNEIRGHFGHLMTESLSRMWSWPAAQEIAPDVKVLVGAARKRRRIAEWEYAFYEACGIPRDRIVLIEGPVRVERLLSGTPMFSNPHYVHPRIVETWDRIGDTLASQAEERDRPRRIFIARKIKKRACTNADEVEALFVAAGFTIVYPEDYPLGEQVAMFRAAEVVAGYAGSGMFQIAFVPHPVHVIQLGSVSYTPRNEVLMAAVRRHRIDGIISLAHGKGVQSAFTFDMAREGPYLRSILDALPPLEA